MAKVTGIACGSDGCCRVNGDAVQLFGVAYDQLVAELGRELDIRDRRDFKRLADRYNELARAPARPDGGK